MKIDLGNDTLDLYVDGKFVLHIGQVSDENTINLFLYPEGSGLIESLIHENDPTDPCTHELLVMRNDKQNKQTN